MNAKPAPPDLAAFFGFRAPTGLSEAIRTAAVGEGKTISDFLREAAERAVERHHRRRPEPRTAT